MKMSKMMVSCSFDQINAEQDDISENDEAQISNKEAHDDKNLINLIVILNPMTNIFVCYVLASHINDKLKFKLNF